MESNEVWACGTSDLVIGFPHYTVKEIMEVLHVNGFRRVPIVEGENTLKGIIVIADIMKLLSDNPSKIDEETLSLMTKDLHLVKSTETVKTAVQIMIEKNVGCLPIVLTKNELLGIITERDILNCKGLSSTKLNNPVSQHDHNSEFLIVPSSATVKEALSILVEKDVRRGILVQDDIMKGIVTASDILAAFLREGLPIMDKKVKQISTAEVLSISPTTPVAAAIALMRQENIGQIPIVEDTKPIGIFTEHDVLFLVAEP